MIGILACVPDRQRTLRELEIGRTLIKRDGVWVIKHGPDDYKTGSTYGQRPLMQLDAALYDTLELFIDEHRPHLNPDHSTLFVGQNGAPITRQQVYYTITRTMYVPIGQSANRPIGKGRPNQTRAWVLFPGFWFLVPFA